MAATRRPTFGLGEVLQGGMGRATLIAQLRSTAATLDALHYVQGIRTSSPPNSRGSEPTPTRPRSHARARPLAVDSSRCAGTSAFRGRYPTDAARLRAGRSTRVAP